MSPEIAQDADPFQSYQENYRAAFRRYAQVVEEWMSLQQSAEADLRELRETHARIRDAEAACRAARDRLACLLLERKDAGVRDKIEQLCL